MRRGDGAPHPTRLRGRAPARCCSSAGLIEVLSKEAVPSLIFAVETGWYTGVAAALSASAPQAAYLRAKLWVDRAAGAVLGALGMELAGSQALS